MSAAETHHGVAAGAPQIVDPLRFPLSGSRLIEASAGTGKTFTIAALYLRLVLGSDGRSLGTAPGTPAPVGIRPLTPPEILVVTFTEAATKELRDRIRSRLSAAAAAFLMPAAEVLPLPPGRDFLHDLRDTYPPEQWPLCARRLQLASEWMDEAAVSTIHGWCNRMLSEHAFDSDSLFTQHLETDQTELFAETVRDYWRTFLYPLDADGSATVGAWWRHPDELRHQLVRLMPHAEALDPAAEPAQVLRETRDEAAATLAALKAPWVIWVEEIQALLDDAAKAKRVDAKKLRPQFYNKWLQALRDWCATPSSVMPDITATGWQRLTPDSLAEAWKDPAATPTHPGFTEMTSLRQRLEQLPTAREAVLRHAATWVAARFAKEQARRAQMGFDDLLSRLDLALRGPNGPRLAALIRRQFPVALIDEFQDTDPIQYRIFDAIYAIAAGTVASHAAPATTDEPTALIMIGDPKQAIYAFRGADIHTYLAARRHTAPHHYTLGTNYRATAHLVHATNSLFAAAEARGGRDTSQRGAFLMRGATHDALPFVPVAAQGRDERWWIDGAPAPSLTVWSWDESNADKGAAAKAPSKSAYIARLAKVCATEIAQLLILGQQQRAGFAPASAAGTLPAGVAAGGGRPMQTSLGLEPLRAVTPGDIAVLVNNGREALAVREAMAACGVRSVYLSDRASVYAGEAARELQRWLVACAAPDDDRALRAALASAPLGLSWQALDKLNQDELEWEARVIQFRGYRSIWQRQGVLPMLRRLLHDFRVPQRLLSAGNERDLTDLLHLSELLQQAGALLDGEHALIRFLAEQRDDSDAESDARKVRLESDNDLVKVITIHKSKGLEYPLVFVPFVSAFRAAKADDLPLRWRDDDDTAQLSLSPRDDVLARVDDERLGEDLRKFYVALTRARFAVWLGAAPLADWARSAVGYLLGAPEDGSLSFDAALAAWAAADAEIAVIPAPVPRALRYREDRAERPLGPSLPVRLSAREPWWIASYSALRHGPIESGPLAATERDVKPASAEEDIYAQSADDAALDDDASAALGDGAGDDASGVDGLDGVMAIADDIDSDHDTSMHEASTRVAASDLSVSLAAAGLHDFPRGASPGTFLHELLEWAARQGFAAVLATPAACRDYIARRCQLRGWDAWTSPLYEWLLSYLAAPLALPGAGGMRLDQLRGYQAEMEFWFAVRDVDVTRLDHLVTRATCGAAPRATVLPNHLNGMLKGFIDLVFEHDGRYYTADYKSNWLGPADADYSTAAMERAILDKRYDLQSVLYVFALHRLLRSRLRDYDYERHVGGALTLFLRGRDAASQGLYVERPPWTLIEALERLFTAVTPRHIGRPA